MPYTTIGDKEFSLSAEVVELQCLEASDSIEYQNSEVSDPNKSQTSDS